MDILESLQERRRRGEPVALATVVASQPPTSARPGDRALVLASGELIGWVGGSCAQPTVQREGLRALADGRSRLIRLSPDVGAGPSREGVVEDAMTCHSGGALEIYVEPFLPAPEMIVAGDSPVADAVARLGALADFRVVRGIPTDAEAAEPGERYVVIAGMSGEDEVDLDRALRLGPGYVGFVGSRKRLAEVSARLRQRGLSEELLARVKGPAGLDIGAATAVEIAISILAEVVQRRRGRAAESQPTQPHQADALSAQPDLSQTHTTDSQSARSQPPAPGSGQSRSAGPRPKAPTSVPAVAEAVDPVCGMRVAIPGARHVYDHAGRSFYFCCPACKRAFAADPERYLAAAGPG